MLEEEAGIGRIQTAPKPRSCGFERRDAALLGLIAKHAATVLATDVFKKDLLSAAVAMECFHERMSQNRWTIFQLAAARLPSNNIKDNQQSDCQYGSQYGKCDEHALVGKKSKHSAYLLWDKSLLLHRS